VLSRSGTMSLGTPGPTPNGALRSDLNRNSSPVMEIDGAAGSFRSRWIPKKSRGRFPLSS